MGKVVSLQAEGSNLHIEISSPISKELKIDQSIAHDGVCLTVVECNAETHRVTAIQETLNRSNLGYIDVGVDLNLERCLRVTDRLDGHIVQGHVDTIGHCERIKEKDGSWEFTFSHPQRPEFTTIPKGSITINGVSLTVVNSTPSTFSVAIIPYTFENTNFKFLKPGSPVNLEFDIIGKYISTYLERYGLK